MAGARLPCEAVVAVVEIVSPSTVSMDRAIKPLMYAEAGIPVYWRVELQGPAKIVVCSLSRGRYVTRATLMAGARGRITRPFAVQINPAELTGQPVTASRFRAIAWPSDYRVTIALEEGGRGQTLADRIRTSGGMIRQRIRLGMVALQARGHWFEPVAPTPDLRKRPARMITRGR